MKLFRTIWANCVTCCLTNVESINRQLICDVKKWLMCVEVTLCLLSTSLSVAHVMCVECSSPTRITLHEEEDQSCSGLPHELRRCRHVPSYFSWPVFRFKLRALSFHAAVSNHIRENARQRVHLIYQSEVYGFPSNSLHLLPLGQPIPLTQSAQLVKRLFELQYCHNPLKLS